jgi:enoyl-CoA hydratase/carnithine racemase
MPLVTTRREGAACVLTLDRPDKLNALSTELERDLEAALQSDDVRTSRVVVVRGEGRAFCAGADLNQFGDRDLASILEYYRATGDVYEHVAALPQPSIAALHGWTLGGGLELALACDFRVADETARVGLPEVAIGIVPSSGGLLRLTRLVGPGRARELMLLRDHVDAAEALRLGVVTEVVPAGEALARSLELAEALAGRPALAVEIARRAADAAAESSRDALLLIERLAYGALAGTADAAEAVQAFEQKREPRFTGR